MRIGIVGLGLMGGSFAKAIKKHTSHTVYAQDLSKETIKTALDDKNIDFVLDQDNIKNLDLLILSMDLANIREFILQNAKHISKDTIVIDIAGVKNEIFDYIEYTSINNFIYISVHPMAGREKSGYLNSINSLFKGTYMIVIPSKTTTKESLEKLKDVCFKIGFKDITLSTKEKHDEMIAYTSQLPHILSSAFVKSKSAKEHKGYSADSFKDLTRVANLDAALWSSLFIENKANILSEIDEFVLNILEYKKAIENDDKEHLISLLDEGSKIKKEI